MKSRLSLLALATCLALSPSLASSQQRAAQAAIAPAPAWPQQGSDLPADPDVRYGTLPNGMRYALRRNATPPGNASLRLRFDAGSLHEAEDQRGLAHFIEHMVMNGTRNVPEGEFVRRLERHGLRFGPDTNASTEFTQTVYKLDLPRTDAATVDEALFLLREAAGEALLAPAAIDAERGIIQSEERTRSTPQLRALFDQLGFLLPGQLLPNRFPIGQPEVIARAQRDRFAAFYDAWYRPERATLIAVGDFNLDEMEARIRARFSDWRGRGPAPRSPELGTVRARGGSVRLFVEPGTQAQLSLTWVRPPDLRPDARAVRTEQLANLLALQVLNRRLGRLAADEQPPFVVSQAVLSTLADSADLLQVIAILPPGDWRRGLAAVELGGAAARAIWREPGGARHRACPDPHRAHRPGRRRRDAPVGGARRGDGRRARPGQGVHRAGRDSAPVRGGRPRHDARADRRRRTDALRRRPDGLSGHAGRDRGRRGGASHSLRRGSSRARRRAAGAAGAGLALYEFRHRRTWSWSGATLPAAIGATAVRFANGVRLTVKQTEFQRRPDPGGGARGQWPARFPGRSTRSGLGARPRLPRRRARPDQRGGHAAGAGGAAGRRGLQRRRRRLSAGRRHAAGGFRAADAVADRLGHRCRLAADGMGPLQVARRADPRPARGDSRGRAQPRIGRAAPRRRSALGDADARADGGEQHRRCPRHRRARPQPGADRGDRGRRHQRRRGDQADRRHLRRAAAAGGGRHGAAAGALSRPDAGAGALHP